jgi:hypothetical protein
LGMSASAYSDPTGMVSGFVPADRKLLLSATTRCGGTLINKEIGPFSGATDLGDISITVPAESKVTFTGIINNCSGQPMQNGYADIEIGSVYERAPVVNGVLNYSYFRCGNTDIKAFYRITDVENKVIGDIQEVHISGNTGSIGTVAVCEGTNEEYLTYTIDTIYRRYAPPFDTVYHSKTGNTQYVHYTNGSMNLFLLKFDLNESNMEIIPDYLTLLTNDIIYESVGDLSIQLTEYGAIGGYVAGTFSALVNTLPQPLPGNVTITGKFRLKRKE